MTLEQSFAEAAKKVTESLDQESDNWAAWILSAEIDMVHPKYVLAPKEDQDTETWNEKQRALLTYLLNTEDMSFKELKQLILDIGNVDEIWDVCFHHLCWMYGVQSIEDPEDIDEFLDMAKGCEKCVMGAGLYAYQYAVAEKPFSFVESQQMAHADLIWAYASHVEQMLLPLIELHKNYKVRVA